MKKILMAVVALLLALILVSCGTTFDGYSYSIEDARKGEEYYNKYDSIFTAKQDHHIIDFIIFQDYLRIVKFDCQMQNDNNLYKVKSKSQYSISESLAIAEASSEDRWVKTGNLPVQVEFLISSNESNKSRPETNSFEFVYNNMKCTLVYRIVG